VNEPLEVYPILEDGGCHNCDESIGLCWVGGNPDGSDAEEFFPYWVHGRMLLCQKCHEIETAPIRERVLLPPEDWQPEVGGWILVHTRATDRVYFGPFETLLEVEEWMRDVGRHRGVSPTLIPLVSPASNPDNLWQDPIRDFQVVHKDSLDNER
jgi:hypothetical protein